MADILDPIDAETLAIAVQLYLDDVNDFQTNRKGKNREDDITDQDLAMEAWQEELQTLAQLVTDRTLCESIARAVAQDADLIGAAVQEDNQAAEDRNIALRMSDPTDRAAAQRTPTPSYADIDDELEARLRRLNLSGSTQSDSWTEAVLPVTAESSSAAAARYARDPRPARSRPRVACIACGDTFAAVNTYRVPCGHDYCHGCIESLVTASTADESLFPPRCCNQPLPLSDQASAPFTFLPADLYVLYRKKKDEFETVDRTYCHVATCSEFLSISADIRGEIGTCPMCQALTCVVCKGAAHDGSVCPGDAASQEVLRIARENGWQQCHGCKRLVELDTGCNHMTCLCGAQFCYICGTQWKNCSCAQWNEDHLLARAEAVVDRNPNAHMLDRANLVRRERQNLIENHECAHTAWRSRQGEYRCEECHDTLPEFIYECRQCRIMACRRCRYNRL